MFLKAIGQYPLLHIGQDAEAAGGRATTGLPTTITHQA